MAGQTSSKKQKSAVSAAPEKSVSTVAAEQLVYARILNVGMKIGLISIVITFLLYITGMMAPKLAIDDVINNWNGAPQVSAKEDSSVKDVGASAGTSAHANSESKKTGYDILLEKNGIQQGWNWVKLYKYSDFLNMFPIAFLASITIVCYLAIVPALFRKGDTLYGTLAIIEVLILVGAASGIISGGGH